MCCTIVLLHSLIYDEDGGIAGADSCMSEVHIARLVQLAFMYFKKQRWEKLKFPTVLPLHYRAFYNPQKFKTRDGEEEKDLRNKNKIFMFYNMHAENIIIHSYCNTNTGQLIHCFLVKIGV